MKDFITPQNHINFSAKKLFSDEGEILDGSIAYLQPNGGGPVEMHTHEHDHLFIVVSGQAKVKFKNGKETVINENESCIVYGNTPHSVWNNCDKTTVMVGISVKNRAENDSAQEYKKHY